MSKVKLSAPVVLGIGISLGLAYSSTLSPSLASAQDSPRLKEIHVDQRCKILQDQSDALTDFTESELENDHVICHIESAHTSSHVEESLSDGVLRRSKVKIVEQEYLLQNVTSAAVTFVVEQPLAEDWKIDSDPQPTEVVDGKAFFRVNAEPGQIVRLHVGERHADPITDPGSGNQ